MFFSKEVIFYIQVENEFIIDLNLLISPYFSLIGNLGNSNLSLLISITPECCPKANLKFFEI